MVEVTLFDSCVDREEYDKVRALSYSGMKDLAVSPYRYWYRWINPERPEREETPALRFGNALHCAVLERDEYPYRYCRELVAAEIDGCLVTIEDIRGWIRDKGFTPKGTRKAEVIAQAQGIDWQVPIFDVIESQFNEENKGKSVLSADEWDRVDGASKALLNEPALWPVLEIGRSEVCFVVDHPEGVKLKARMDWITPVLTLDIKTFSQQSGKSIDKCVNDALFYEGYFDQAYMYSLVRSLAEGNASKSGAQTAKPHWCAFVESDKPHEVRLRALRPKNAGEVNLYWEQSRARCSALISSYKWHWDTYGENPWRSAQDVHTVADQDIQQLAYARLA